MYKIDEQYYLTGDIMKKVNELVEGNNEIMKRLEKMDRRIAILYHNEPCGM